MSGDSILPKLPLPGEIVDEKYEIVGVLGTGGMGVVFEAVHLRLHQRVALKMLHPHVTGEPGVMERFEREARAAGQLRSPNIARVLDVETSKSELPYIVMEFLEGRDLDDELAAAGRLPVSDAVDYLLQACVAMREAHSLGIIHRDLKPANMFLCASAEGPTIKIVDFGISKITSEADGRLTAAMTTLGSPVYMSPEQLRGASEVDARADIWGLGVVLFELIAGRPPHLGTVTVVTAAIVADAAPKLSSLRHDVPAELEAVVAKALRKDPKERYPDAESFAEALAPFASAEGAKRLRAALSIAVMPTSSRRFANGGPTHSREDSTMMVQPAGGATGAPSDTRHSFSTLSVVRSGRSKSTRTVLLFAGAGVVAGVIAIAFLFRLTSTPVGSPPAGQPVNASATGADPMVAPLAPPPTSPGASVAVGASVVPSGATATAADSTPASSSAASSSFSTHSPVAKPLPPRRVTPAPAPAPAATTNPLRL